MINENITIYRTSGEPGWVYRSTSPNGSGAIDEPVAAAALDDLYDQGFLSDAQRDALDDLAEGHGWNKAYVILDGVGPLWPGV